MSEGTGGYILPEWVMELRREGERLLLDGQTPPDLLFHYTSVDAAFSILDRDPLLLRASSAFCMNDTAEITYGLDLVKETAAGIVPKSEVDSWFAMHHSRPEYTQLSFMEGTTILSFCGEADLLSQWRAYGIGGSGCAIGFRRAGLQDAANKRSFRLTPVVYDEGRQRNILTELFRFTSALPVKVDTSELWGRSLSKAIEVSLSFKNESFAEEREWRLISTNAFIKYRGGRQSVVPYSEIDVTRECVAELWLGPTLDQQMARRNWEMYLDSNYGVHANGQSLVPVRPSKITLRLS